MASRARQRRRKNKMPGNTRMDAALDAMHQFGFGTQLVRNTVKELLDVYDGVQGWPFIEETSYKLLIETLLGKQQGSSEEDKDGVNETQSTGIFEVGSSNLVAQDTLLHSRDDLDFSFKTNDEDYASHVNLRTDVRDSAVLADKGGHERSIMVESKNELKPVDTVKGSNASTFVNNIKSSFDETPMVQSSEAFHHVPLRRRKGYLGWISNDSDDDGEYIHFPIPPLSKQIEKMIGQCEPPQSGSRRRRKSRWDEKPDGM